MDYCALSAAPVGRFVLDVHEEDPSMWPASDAVCSALQIINHLQDCPEDYKRLDRAYLPLDTLAAHGASVEMLDAPKAPPPLRVEPRSSRKSRTCGLAPRSRRSMRSRDVSRATSRVETR